MKSQIMGREVVVAITKGKLDFSLGSGFTTGNSTGTAASELWSKPLGNNSIAIERIWRAE